MGNGLVVVVVLLLALGATPQPVIKTASNKTPTASKTLEGTKRLSRRRPRSQGQTSIRWVFNGTRLVPHALSAPWADTIR